MSSYLECNARERIQQLFDPNSLDEFLPPSARVISPHLGQLNAPVAFDDGVVVGKALLHGETVFIAAQEGGFMGGAVGEVHGAKLVGMLRRAVIEKPCAVVLLLETGGVRLHEANAGLIAVSEVMRAVLDTRAAGIPVIVLIGGSNGCFGGMGIVARCANWIVMSEEARLAMSGPEVIETANGVEEFDSRDRALVWRTTGGKHRYIIGDCQAIVTDSVEAFRAAAIEAVQVFQTSGSDHSDQIALSLGALESEQELLAQRINAFGTLRDPLDIWRALGMHDPANMPMLEISDFISKAQHHRLGAA
ncbi:biotin-independent malonate decarboxylase subunit beta [Undibacterium sp. Rencai35W]|uniref:biotin-independent malonate decarboxylase subunit beta n=1 Tax=Undibacterium sp. Rencai35W TaxID=3413046 RepID=UPI003BF308AF